MLQLVDIQKSFDGYNVLGGINVRLNTGDIVGLLGENGVGKTTMLKILSGITQDYSGSIIYQDVEIENLQEFKKKVGFLSERNPLYPQMYVKEYLSYIALHYSINNPKIKIEEVINQVGISDKSHLKIYQLSKGYKQRVGLASALLNDPEILILDEPINGLDPKQILQYRQLLRSMSHGRIIILSSHLMQEIEALCDRVLFISDGVISSDNRLVDQDLSTISFFMTTAKSLDIKFLKDEPSIADIKELSKNEYEIRSVEGMDSRQVVFQQLAATGNYILELRLKEQNLTDLFHSS